MTRRSWVQDPETGKLIPKEEYRRRDSGTAYIQGDIESFVSPIDGTVIDDRGKLRRHMEQHGVTDSRDYSPEYMRGLRERKLRNQRREDNAHRTELLKRAFEQ